MSSLILFNESPVLITDYTTNADKIIPNFK